MTSISVARIISDLFMTENYSQLSILEMNMSQNILGTISVIQRHVKNCDCCAITISVIQRHVKNCDCCAITVCNK